MKIRYVANACFLITLASGRKLLTDPWFEGYAQQTWRNFPPVPDEVKQEIYASHPDFIYISHIHQDHLQAQTLCRFDRATPILIGKLNTPNLRSLISRLGFSDIREFAFEQRVTLTGADCDLVMFGDFNGNTQGDTTLVEYDLDTSIYLFDGDGARVFNAVDNTILPRDAERIALEYGPPDVAILPYASASLFPMAMDAYSDAEKLAASERIRRRTAGNFREVVRALGAKRVIPAGGEYVLGGPKAALSRFLPQPLETDLADEIASLGHEADALAKLYPGDQIDTGDATIRRDPRATFRGFDDAERLAYALTLADDLPSYTGLNLPADLEVDWPRILRRCAANFTARRQKMGLELPIDIRIKCQTWPEGEPRFQFRMAMDSAENGMDETPPGRAHLTYRIDEKMLFCLSTGLLSWNAMEASALLGVRREPDQYVNDVHRSIVHFTLLS